MELALRGAGGEPVSFLHTINSHGLAALPPSAIDASVPAFGLTVRIGEVIRTAALHRT